MTEPTMRKIRKASLPDDAEKICEVFAAAKRIMRDAGNMNQWHDGYPSIDVVESDLAADGAFVIEDSGRIVAYFAFLPSPEPTYSAIFDGEWVDDVLPYHVIHRIASVPDAHGIFDSVMNFCFNTEQNIRMDTHRDNYIMQHLIERYGFDYCGIIYLKNGDERLAYQRVISTFLPPSI